VSRAYGPNPASVSTRDGKRSKDNIDMQILVENESNSLDAHLRYPVESLI
jgi:uncharacterized protein (UPF0276 family)